MSQTVVRSSSVAIQFRRHWWRTVIPALFAVVVLGLFASRISDAIWIAIAGLSVILIVCALLHGGLVVSREGIAWYMLRPKWRYRVIPWHAVIDVRKHPLGLAPFRLIVEHGKYESWVWGKPQAGREMDFNIWPNGYSGGEAIWYVVHDFWRAPEVSRGSDAPAA